MSLPVPPSYLAKALQDGCKVKDVNLKHQRVGDLVLATGQLVACDPFVFPEMDSFTLPVPRGTFPVILSIAHIGTDQRVAFAAIHFREAAPVAWKMLTVGDQDTATLKKDEYFGYGVDAGTGCFMDRSTGRLLNAKMSEETAFYETMIAEMEKTYRHTWSWLDMKFGDGNLVAFSSGFGDGSYATYAGFDTNGGISTVVTDFGVAPLDEETSSS